MRLRIPIKERSSTAPVAPFKPTWFVFGEKGLIADLSLEGSKVTKIKATG